MDCQGRLAGLGLGARGQPEAPLKLGPHPWGVLWEGQPAEAERGAGAEGEAQQAGCSQVLNPLRPGEPV